MHLVKNPAFSLMLSFFMALVLSACGPRLVRGEPPYVSIREMDATGDTVLLRMRMQNINGVTIKLTRVRFSIELGDELLGRHEAASQASIIANGTETLSFELDASEPGRALLSSLEQGEIPNLEFHIEGELETVDEGTLSFSGNGRIYPMPGRPGRFR